MVALIKVNRQTVESQLKIEEWEYFSLKMINFTQESHILSDLDFRVPMGPNRNKGKTIFSS